eukprot:8532891-Pyramimonas_sp.AAC.1
MSESQGRGLQVTSYDGWIVHKLPTRKFLLSPKKVYYKSGSMSIWYKVAGLSGASAVGAAAYGAHGFKPEDPYFNKFSPPALRHDWDGTLDETSECGTLMNNEQHLRSAYIR